MNSHIQIRSRRIGPGEPCYCIAEMSANHGQRLDQAVAIIHAMKEAGADAVKVQTYTADTLTIDCDNEHFRIGGGTLWDGRTLHDLYREASMPWEWQPRLKAQAEELGLDFFSTPFDATAVDFLDGIGVPAHKVASFEIVDIPLLQKVASSRKPVILSTGMATREEIGEAVAVLEAAGCRDLVLLKCTSAYPALPDEMNLRTMADMAERFRTPVGLSDHTGGHAVALAAVALGACIVEKHFTLSRSVPGPDSAFSLEPAEFRAMVEGIRVAEKALGRVNYAVSPDEDKSRVFRRSLFVVEDVRQGETFTAANVRSIRPGNGLHTRHLPEILGRKAGRHVRRGTPLAWDLLA